MEIVSASRAKGIGFVRFIHSLAAKQVTLVAARFVLIAVAVSLLAGCNGVVTTGPSAPNGSGSSDSTAPVIVTQPASQSVTAGQAATFTVVATGSPTLTYQWQKNHANIAGATSASYTTPVTATSDSGETFDVVVSNSVGTVTSVSVGLTVNAVGSTAPPVNNS